MFNPNDLSFLPEAVDADSLAEVLYANWLRISLYCRWNVRNVLRNFLAEDMYSMKSLHDNTHYAGMRFDREFTEIPGSGNTINPRLVVENLKQALSILRAGWIVPLKFLNRKNWRALSFSQTKYMTLDWQNSYTVGPAFRYAAGVDKIFKDDFNMIVDVIKWGRTYLQSKSILPVEQP